MTINIQMGEIAAALSAISVSGVTVLDIDTLPEDCTTLGPVLFPRPDGFISDLTVEFVSFGSGGTAKMNVTYTMTYRYLHASIGTGALFANYAGLIANLALILERLLATDVGGGAIDIQVNGAFDIGPLEDPAGNVFHGVDVSLRVLEYAQ